MRALISGASKGIGKAIAKGLAEKGYDLVLIARELSGLNELKESIKHNNIELSFITADLSDKEQRAKVCKELQQFKDLSLVVNNVGRYEEEDITKLKENKLLDMLQLNLMAAIELSNSVLPQLVLNKGTIVNIGSVMSVESSKVATNYAISKHALKAWNDALKEELRSKKVKVCAIYPGPVYTNSWEGIKVEQSELIQAGDIAKAVVLLTEMAKNTLVDEIRLSPLDWNTSQL